MKMGMQLGVYKPTITYSAFFFYFFLRELNGLFFLLLELNPKFGNFKSLLL